MAGIIDPLLRRSYTECKRLNATHGRTYFLATLLLPKSKRPFVHALYGFARYADEIVDDLSGRAHPIERSEQLRDWSQSILASLKSGESEDLVGRALTDTVNRFSIPHEYFEAFIHSMEMDLSINQYESYEELTEYMYGSAAVIGLEMTHVLGTNSTQALEAAKKLGIAFQLANFIRDVSEDLDRGRIYIPMDELKLFGVDRVMLGKKTLTPEILAALKFQIARVRLLQEEANRGIDFLSKESRACIRAASSLYCGIVDEVEAINYDIFRVRAKVSMGRKARVMLRACAEKVLTR